MSALGQQFRGQPFRVLAFPVSQYFDQEPGTNAQIEKYVSGSGAHTWEGHPQASWQGQIIPPALFFAKTAAFEGVVPDPPSWAPGLNGTWCPSSAASECAPSSAGCCKKNEAVWRFLAKACTGATDPTGPCGNTSYPPAWNFRGKFIFDKCGKLRHGPGADPMASVAPLVGGLLKEAAAC